MKRQSGTYASDGTIEPMQLPTTDASEAELIEHFRQVQNVLACVPYEDAIHLCGVCTKLGENMTGKTSNSSGRNRFCSFECEAVFERRWTTYKARQKPEPEKK